jgi:tight adherence protein B
MTIYEKISVDLAKFPRKESSNFLSIYTLISAIAGFLFAFAVMGSRTLAIPFAVLGMALPYLYSQRKLGREKAALAVIWPELLDHMISGLRSGLSIAETLIGLGYRGPEISRSIFTECEKFLRAGGDVAATFEFIKSSFDDPIADQVCEVLDFARGTGSRDTALTLRTLGDFIRSDMAVRGEINAKLGWVKNSAVVAAIAPWILLAILSAQPSTVLAFSTPTGFFILGAGVMMSAIAYFWMGKVGRIQEIPRIFSTSVSAGTRSKKMYR